MDNNKLKNIHKIAIAPMLDVTTRHFRNMMRLITRKTCLYTEMIHHDTITYSKKGVNFELKIDEIEKPCVIQIGGNNLDAFKVVAEHLQNFDYDEINLNCGCPSSKVQAANFGACLMRSPDQVADCVNVLNKYSNKKVSVKCRLGLDKFDSNFLNDFINKVNKQGQIDHFIIHARLALMNLDTDKNRKIPPLQYEEVEKLQKTFNTIDFSLNGGIRTLDEVELLLNSGIYKGIMIGRAAYDNPWMFSDIDRRFFNTNNLGYCRKEVILKYSEYCEQTLIDDPMCHYNILLKPLTNLFYNERKGKKFINYLHDTTNLKKKQISISEHLKEVVDKFEKLNFEAMNRKP